MVNIVLPARTNKLYQLLPVTTPVWSKVEDIDWQRAVDLLGSGGYGALGAATLPFYPLADPNATCSCCAMDNLQLNYNLENRFRGLVVWLGGDSHAHPKYKYNTQLDDSKIQNLGIKIQHHSYTDEKTGEVFRYSIAVEHDTDNGGLPFSGFVDRPEEEDDDDEF